MFSCASETCGGAGSDTRLLWKTLADMFPYGQAAGFENQNDGTWDAYSIKIEGWTAADQENVAASAESDVGVKLYDACGAPGSPVLSQTGPLKLSITFDIPSSPWGIPLAGGAWYQNIDSFTAQLSTSADPFTAAESATALPRPGWRCFLSSPSACCERASSRHKLHSRHHPEIRFDNGELPPLVQVLSSAFSAVNSRKSVEIEGLVQGTTYYGRVSATTDFAGAGLAS